jgi:hypothetical protein
MRPRHPTTQEDTVHGSLTEHLRQQNIAAEQARTEALPAFITVTEAVQASWEVNVTTPQQLRIVLAGAGLWCIDAAVEALTPIIDQAMQVKVKHWGAAPAVYVQVPYWRHQTIGARRDGYPSNADQIPDAERVAFAQQVLDIGQRLEADERSTRQGPPGEPDVVWNGTGDRPYEVRLWWD